MENKYEILGIKLNEEQYSRVLAYMVENRLNQISAEQIMIIKESNKVIRGGMK